jgi:hypothetical protein
MSKKIKTYNDLLEEQARLEISLRQNTIALNESFHEFMIGMKPVGKAVDMLGKLTVKKDKNFFVTRIADGLIDLLIKKVILRHAGWVKKTTLPFFLKNYTSHLISENKGTILNSIDSIFTSPRHN